MFSLVNDFVEKNSNVVEKEKDIIAIFVVKTIYLKIS